MTVDMYKSATPTRVDLTYKIEISGCGARREGPSVRLRRLTCNHAYDCSGKCFEHRVFREVTGRGLQRNEEQLWGGRVVQVCAPRRVADDARKAYSRPMQRDLNSVGDN